MTALRHEQIPWLLGGGLVAALAAAAVATGVRTSALPRGPQQPEPHSFTLKPAVVKSIESRDGQLTLSVSYQYGTKKEDRIPLVGPDVPMPVATLVDRAWSKPCAGVVGAEVLVAQAEGLPLAVMEGDTVKHPCFVRLYFDLTKPSALPPTMPSEVRYGLGTSLGLISLHHTPASVWIRGAADEVLITYKRPSFMLDAATRRGQPGLASSVQAIHDLGSKLGSQVVLARVIPVRYEPPEQPVGGGWPYFVVELYQDGPVGKPAKIVDYSSSVR
jgi:hypothetical protein